MVGAALLAVGALVAGGPLPWLRVPVGAALGATLGWLADIDLRTHTLPNRIQYPAAAALAAVLVVAGLLGDADGWGGLISGLAVAAGFFVLALLGGGALGLGDVKLGLILGMWTGWFGAATTVTFVIASFLSGGVIAAILMLARRATRTTHIAFGPYLILGAILATYWTAFLADV